MEYIKMEYYPDRIYYETRNGVNYIVLDYGDSKVEHVVVQKTLASEMSETEFEAFKEEFFQGGGHDCSTDYIVRRCYEAGFEVAQQKANLTNETMVNSNCEHERHEVVWHCLDCGEYV